MANKIDKNKRMIWGTLFDVEEWRDGFEEYCEINGLDSDEEDVYEWITMTIGVYLDDEKDNLNKPLCGDILAIADLGLWNGRYSGYQIIRGANLNNIFNIRGDHEDIEFYCDRYQVKCDMYHHDGTNHITFYEIRQGVNIQPLLDKIYNQEEVSKKEINRYCRSLRPLVASVYGW